ncbi:hypothetical protein ASPZODRAFT_68809 [Penicilliopsis zonata CBS 506.65]|uniref:Probable beta-galactosidase B n=1 Tax=Penicilliopsis zonata CBS 506.65 TaxID=1073090 RepID=A0A1L9SEX3_9EURO|nr:hypothetical protein ASPZODRAFT_68809 [Penicilliopsis zonata CBS 506.65]OJJ45756.1 hypothetical protein ASPZODRAFT_68809 [Penicilliopsis zonata CBS 506.65]
MRPYKWALALLSCLGAGAVAENATDSQWPLDNDGLTNVVEWDHYSFLINNERVFIFSGEFHYWRIPVPELWIDILEKIKALGFTTFSIYVNWGYHAPNNYTVDFSTEAHDITPVFELAEKVGLYQLVRPGPYINAETNAGGFPLWLTTGAYGTLRDNDTRYIDALEPYWSKISQLTSDYMITEGHNAICYQIENEYSDQWLTDATERVPNETAIAYMEILEASARANGIKIPLTVNEANTGALSWIPTWSDAGGNVDVTGLDSYPACWTCATAACGDVVPYEVVDYYAYFQYSQPTLPSFMPEFQGGGYNPWGGPEGGCENATGTEWVNLFYRWNVAQRVTAMSLYMIYGGTNWGATATTVTATSYDYSAAISEDRSIGTKYYEIKLLALFTRSATDLTETDMIGNGTQYTNNAAIKAFELQNPKTKARFYPTFHNDTTSDTNEVFNLKVNTSEGALTIPRHGNSIRLNGHQSKIIVTDFTFGDKTLLYSTAEVLTYAIFDSKPTLVLWVPTGESGEFNIKGAKSGSVERCDGCSGVGFYPELGGVTVKFTQSEGMTVLSLNDGTRVVVLDRTTAYYFWAPALTNNPTVPDTESVLVQGPYLVRGATLSGSTLSITGDVVNATTLEVFAPSSVTTIKWNGRKLSTSATSYGSRQVSLDAAPAIKLPALSSWKSNDSLPERFASYDDSGLAWVAADDMTTPNPEAPETLPVLYADQYGFHNGVRLWRGYFTGSATGVYLNVQGGEAFGWSAWLNGDLVGSWLGNADDELYNLTLSFSNVTVNTDSTNVLLVVHDDTGHDETTGALNPRGILGAELQGRTNSTQFSHWRVAGTAGGESNLDPVRGVYNEDGLYAERVGWHLPGFDDSAWSDTTDPSDGFTGATVRFYRTVVPLALPTDVDVSISFLLSTVTDNTAFRVQLFVNGYQYGRFNPYIGNQVVFPVPPGILDYQGDNTIGLAVWAQTEAGAQVGLDWRVNYVADSSLDVSFDGSALRPKWTEERLQYA